MAQDYNTQLFRRFTAPKGTEVYPSELNAPALQQHPIFQGALKNRIKMRLDEERAAALKLDTIAYLKDVAKAYVDTREAIDEAEKINENYRQFMVDHETEIIKTFKNDKKGVADFHKLYKAEKYMKEMNQLYNRYVNPKVGPLRLPRPPGLARYATGNWANAKKVSIYNKDDLSKFIQSYQ